MYTLKSFHISIRRIVIFIYLFFFFSNLLVGVPPQQHTYYYFVKGQCEFGFGFGFRLFGGEAGGLDKNT